MLTVFSRGAIRGGSPYICYSCLRKKSIHNKPRWASSAEDYGQRASRATFSASTRHYESKPTTDKSESEAIGLEHETSSGENVAATDSSETSSSVKSKQKSTNKTAAKSKPTHTPTAKTVPTQGKDIKASTKVKNATLEKQDAKKQGRIKRAKSGIKSAEQKKQILAEAKETLKRETQKVKVRRIARSGDKTPVRLVKTETDVPLSQLSMNLVKDLISLPTGAEFVKAIQDDKLSTEERTLALRYAQSKLVSRYQRAIVALERMMNLPLGYQTLTAALKSRMVEWKTIPAREVNLKTRGVHGIPNEEEKVMPLTKGKGKQKLEVQTISAEDLNLHPIHKPQPPVPTLAYGLERVLFNQGVYNMRDPRSRVYNFDPYLETIMPVDEFDYNALKPYITSSKDKNLSGTAGEESKKYRGSTSSMTSALAHFHYLLSQWRPINPALLSKNMPIDHYNFTALHRAPAAIFLRYKNGSYAIDADKMYDTPNILAILGKSMEKQLTLSKEEFEKYRKINSHTLSAEQRDDPESFHYTTMGDFLMRSQLDAHDPRLPGTGMFDLKTRAVVSVRMNLQEYEVGKDYEIQHRHGEWESFEREYYDMIRAAFLKYSLQVRMGRMDGIFVAYHNTQRMFGFQYVSLPEMDFALHGSNNTATGDAEFKLSLRLLNEFLDKATARFPEKSLRIHFETRPTTTNYMYIFAEPMEEEEIDGIQSTNQEEIARFEESVFSISSDRSKELEEKKRLEEWEALRAKVEEGVEQDELGIEDARVVAEQLVEESGILRSGNLSPKEVGRLVDELLLSLASTDLGSTSEEAEDTGDSYIEAESDGSETEREDSVSDTKEAGQSAVDVEEEDDDDDMIDISEDDCEKEPSDEREDDIELNKNTEDEVLKEDHEGDVEDNQGDIEDDVEEDFGENSEEDLEESEEVDDDSEGLKGGISEHASVPDTQTDSSETATPSLNGSDDDLGDVVHGVPVTKKSSQKAIKKEQKFSQDILGMTLTIRNKVNGKYVKRPEDLKDSDGWEVEYVFSEMPMETAESTYIACKKRRQNALNFAKSTGNGIEADNWNTQYLLNLQNLSKQGKEFRNAQTTLDRETPLKFWSNDIKFSNESDTKPDAHKED